MQTQANNEEIEVSSISQTFIQTSFTNENIQNNQGQEVTQTPIKLSPKEKLDLGKESLEKINKNEDIKGLLENLTEQDKVQEQIEKTEKRHAKEMEELEKSFQKEENKEQENKDFKNPYDEAYQKAKLELEKKHKAELEALKGEKEELMMNFDRAMSTGLWIMSQMPKASWLYSKPLKS